MKKLAITLFLLAFVMAAKADPGQYTVNDQAIENIFTNGINVSKQPMTALNTRNPFFTNGLANSTAMASANGGKNAVTAILLDFFLGELGIHRIYLGTKTMTWVGYILTCGGVCGIVPFVDLIVLIVHSQDISPYVDNPKFFMWGGE
ncbi:MAG TPA: TM2 domain-containing protein [Chitinophagaceae bacterium]|nr:TM2 domain-containing protein [Chitinophagaceae bacterium]